MSAEKGPEMQTKVWLNDPTGGYHFKGHGIGERIFLSAYEVWCVPYSRSSG
jgi:hypothetical protein